MVRDPVCGMDIDEINSPEGLQAEWDGRMYYFCSPECKLEFEKATRKFIATRARRIEDLDAA